MKTATFVDGPKKYETLALNENEYPEVLQFAFMPPMLMDADPTAMPPKNFKASYLVYRYIGAGYYEIES